jgi:hypothetical protein
MTGARLKENSKAFPWIIFDFGVLSQVRITSKAGTYRDVIMEM